MAKKSLWAMEKSKKNAEKDASRLACEILELS